MRQITLRSHTVRLTVCLLLAFLPFYGFGLLVGGITGTWWLALLIALGTVCIPRFGLAFLALAFTLKYFLFERTRRNFAV